MTPEPPEHGKPAALRLEIRRAPADEAPGLAPPARRRGGAGALAVRALAALGIALAACALAAWAAVPWLVRRAFVGAAADHGVALSIQSVEIGLSGFELGGVEATADAVPGVRLTAPQMDVQTSGLAPQKVTITGAELAIHGRWSAVAADVERWLMGGSADKRGFFTPKALVIDGSRVAWQGIWGDGAGVQAAGLHLEAAWQDAAPPTWHATSEIVTVSVPRGSLGPWRVDVDRSPGASRVRVAFDPGVPDSSWLVALGDDRAIASIDVNVPRSPIARLGIPPSILGLDGDLQIAASAHYVALGARTTATTTGGIYGVKARGLPRPIDVAWEGSAAGETGGALDVKAARVAVGPLAGAVRGTVKPFDDGFRVDLGWEAGPVPCTAFDTPVDPDRPFDLAYELQKLAQGVGIARVSGTVSARASLAFDSRDVGTSAATFTPEVSCKLALFGSP